MRHIWLMLALIFTLLGFHSLRTADEVNQASQANEPAATASAPPVTVNSDDSVNLTPEHNRVTVTVTPGRPVRKNFVLVRRRTRIIRNEDLAPYQYRYQHDEDHHHEHGDDDDDDDDD